MRVAYEQASKSTLSIAMDRHKGPSWCAGVTFAQRSERQVHLGQQRLVAPCKHTARSNEVSRCAAQQEPSTIEEDRLFVQQAQNAAGALDQLQTTLVVCDGTDAAFMRRQTREQARQAGVQRTRKLNPQHIRDACKRNGSAVNRAQPRHMRHTVD